MTWDQIAQNWEHFRVKVKEKWGHVTDDDLTALEGNRAQFLDLLQVRYGYDKPTAVRELNELVEKLDLPVARVANLNYVTIQPDS